MAQSSSVQPIKQLTKLTQWLKSYWYGGIIAVLILIALSFWLWVRVLTPYYIAWQLQHALQTANSATLTHFIPQSILLKTQTHMQKKPTLNGNGNRFLQQVYPSIYQETVPSTDWLFSYLSMPAKAVKTLNFKQISNHFTVTYAAKQKHPVTPDSQHQLIITFEQLNSKADESEGYFIKNRPWQVTHVELNTVDCLDRHANCL